MTVYGSTTVERHRRTADVLDALDAMGGPAT
jgi:hypothetical protein